MTLYDLANPTRFLKLVKVLLPWLIVATVAALAVGLYFAFFVAPEDYQQGQTVRIMFVHVPAAQLALMCYAMMALSSIGSLVWKHPLADVSAKASAPIGAAFTFLALFSGAIWGKPMWGTFWVWDARLTSFLVLFIMYLGIIALWKAIEDPIKAAKVNAIITLVGVINVVIIKFSVEWWNTLHQPPSIIRADGPAIHSSILIPLGLMALAFVLLFVTLHLMSMRNEIMRRRIRAMRMRAASVAPAASSSTVTKAAPAGAR
ncbi:heme ABC transporter permease [Pseudovibrio brasiliensis]|uniref:Heme exporter protein C n=1 Tax=Pseudovibrio brasiliensis TaxID=1898042 RepID=A0ABX8AMC4_9HYPH|nr:heme ABC transporter permease [Pseudovibrio brasiliensis]QUS55753.1 heme ABC transporter permease [Pseudovibrio brasiliensis]